MNVTFVHLSEQVHTWAMGQFVGVGYHLTAKKIIDMIKGVWEGNSQAVGDISI